MYEVFKTHVERSNRNVQSIVSIVGAINIDIREYMTQLSKACEATEPVRGLWRQTTEVDCGYFIQEKNIFEVYQIIHRIKENPGDLSSEKGRDQDSSRGLKSRNDSAAGLCHQHECTLTDGLYFFAPLSSKFIVPKRERI